MREGEEKSARLVSNFSQLQNDKTSATSAVNGPRERSSDCSIEEGEGVGNVIFIIRRNPRTSPRYVDVVLFLLAAFRERIKEKKRERDRKREREREGRARGGAGKEGLPVGTGCCFTPPSNRLFSALYSSV